MKKILLGLLILTATMFLIACKPTENGNGNGNGNGNNNGVYTIKPVPDCEVPYLDGGWVCTWADEFELDRVDPFKWNFEINDSGGGNNELQYYISDNATVEDGILTITAKKETYLTREYTSSRITTSGKGDFKYGRFQIRAKNPVGRGTWPAIWMMPTRSRYGGWPRSGEIDIMEYVGYDPIRVHATIHTAKFNHKQGTQIGGNKIINSTDQFLVYELLWELGKLTWFIDGEQIFRVVYNPALNDDVFYHEAHPFDQEFFIILNLAIGGDWGGARGVDNSIFPATFQIDYVRYYELDYNMLDKEAPNAVENIFKSSLENTFYWDRPEDDYGVSHYDIYVDGEKYHTANLEQFTLRGKPAGSYEIQIVAVDFTGKESPKSPIFNHTQT